MQSVLSGAVLSALVTSNKRVRGCRGMDKTHLAATAAISAQHAKHRIHKTVVLMAAGVLLLGTEDLLG